ncbi:MAG: hypothetical protein FJ271_29785, partial [Planctomycetes bacterium]|nr:hypothetical protein [Planctomycetota bacterium]
MTYKDILVYADGNKAAKARLDVACALAASQDAHLTALHVRALPYIPADFTGGVPPMVIEWQEQAADEIVSRLRQADVLISQGQEIADVIRQIGVSEVTYYRWRQEY